MSPASFYALSRSPGYPPLIILSASSGLLVSIPQFPFVLSFGGLLRGSAWSDTKDLHQEETEDEHLKTLVQVEGTVCIYHVYDDDDVIH